MAWLPFTLFVYEYLVSVCLFMCITLYFNNNKNQQANHSNKTLVKRHQASHGELNKPIHFILDTHSKLTVHFSPSRGARARYIALLNVTSLSITELHGQSRK